MKFALRYKMFLKILKSYGNIYFLMISIYYENFVVNKKLNSVCILSEFWMNIHLNLKFVRMIYKLVKNHNHSDPERKERKFFKENKYWLYFLIIKQHRDWYFIRRTNRLSGKNKRKDKNPIFRLITFRTEERRKNITWTIL